MKILVSCCVQVAKIFNRIRWKRLNFKILRNCLFLEIYFFGNYFSQFLMFGKHKESQSKKLNFNKKKRVKFYYRKVFSFFYIKENNFLCLNKIKRVLSPCDKQKNVCGLLHFYFPCFFIFLFPSASLFHSALVITNRIVKILFTWRINEYERDEI